MEAQTEIKTESQMEAQARYNNFEIFKNNLSSFKKTSKDTSVGTSYMTQSDVVVVNFDKVKEEYIKQLKLKPSSPPSSVDALFKNAAGDYCFVEFKNGKIDKGAYNIKNKIYDSLLVFNDIIGENIAFCREHVNFILVYNEAKNPNESQNSSQDISSKTAIAKRLSQKGGTRHIKFDLERYEKLYFHRIDTYSAAEFETEFLAHITE